MKGGAARLEPNCGQPASKKEEGIEEGIEVETFEENVFILIFAKNY